MQPKLEKYFPEKFSGAAPEKLYEAQNAVKEPSLIRVESDEVGAEMAFGGI